MIPPSEELKAAFASQGCKQLSGLARANALNTNHRGFGLRGYSATGGHRRTSQQDEQGERTYRNAALGCGNKTRGCAIIAQMNKRLAGVEPIRTGYCATRNE
jgi:hypothetical protein